MAQVVVKVNDRPYNMQCSPGEEEHLAELAQMLDSEVSNIKSVVGQVGDIRLLLMAGLVVADNLSEALKRVEEMQEEMKVMRETSEESRDVDEKASARLDAVAQRIEKLAHEINGSEAAQA